jgi:hypothetical protein
MGTEVQKRPRGYSAYLLDLVLLMTASPLLAQSIVMNSRTKRGRVYVGECAHIKPDTGHSIMGKIESDVAESG